MKYLLRFLSYIAKKAAVLILIIGLCATAFISAMNLSNMFILVNDGMEMRANYVLGKNDGAELYKFFSSDFLYRDELINSGSYTPYKISGSSYTLSINSMWAWPWQTTATAVVEEKVILEGYMKVEYQTPEQLASPDKIPAPAWENKKYELTIRKQNDGSWIITALDTVEDLLMATPRPN